MATILIAETHDEVRMLFAEVVARLGHRVLEVGDLEHELPDVLIFEPADAELLALAHRLRAESPGLPIVCTSIRQPTPASRALGPVALLTKPFGLADLEAAVRLAVAQSGSA